MRKFLITSALTHGIVTLACNGGDVTAPGGDTTSTNTPASVVITPPASSDMIVGSTINLVASVKNATGQDVSGVTITWASSDPTVATVSQTGAHGPQGGLHDHHRFGLRIAGNALGEPVLTWNDNSTDEEFFSIQRTETLTSAVVFFQSPANSTSFTDTTAQPTKAYQYQIRAAIGNRISATPPAITYTRP